jgi:hypothetical protein
MPNTEKAASNRSRINSINDTSNASTLIKAKNDLKSR